MEENKKLARVVNFTKAQDEKYNISNKLGYDKIKTIYTVYHDEQTQEDHKNAQITLGYFHRNGVDISMETKERAIRENPYIISEIKENRKLYAIAIAQNPSVIVLLDQTPDLCNFAIEMNPDSLKYIHNQTNDLCKKAIENSCGAALQHVRNQTDELCRLAIEEDPNNIVYVRNQTEELCLLAVAESGRSLRYVRDKTDEIIETAIEEDGSAIEFVFDKEMRSKYIEDAISNDPLAFTYIKPEEQTASLAIRYCPMDYMEYIRTDLLEPYLEHYFVEKKEED